MITQGILVTGLVVTSVLAPMHHAQAAAMGPKGPCFSSGSEEFDRVVVTRKPVRTASGRRVADVRVVAGHYYSNSSGGAEGTGEYWCVDLVPAPDFASRSPRVTATVTRPGSALTVESREFEDVVFWAGSAPSMPSDALAVEVAIDGRRLHAHRLVRASFPELPPVG